jgi:hypothetical protein
VVVRYIADAKALAAGGNDIAADIDDRHAHAHVLAARISDRAVDDGTRFGE